MPRASSAVGSAGAGDAIAPVGPGANAASSVPNTPVKKASSSLRILASRGVLDSRFMKLWNSSPWIGAPSAFDAPAPRNMTHFGAASGIGITLPLGSSASSYQTGAARSCSQARRGSPGSRRVSAARHNMKGLPRRADPRYAAVVSERGRRDSDRWRAPACAPLYNCDDADGVEVLPAFRLHHGGV
ncbi:MAG: hypothetical protein BWY85_02004 [Firmicutes bacterium ADurb.Bin506]|nr:MAG: hypothetical protein BWY85_02004 [Firmicutes bacterium ADurb.Bin506]